MRPFSDLANAIALAVMFIFTGLPLTCSAAEDAIKTESGLVAGTGAGVRAFKGIPYAAAPLGDLRWKPPQPVEPWEHVREAREFGPPCPQPAVGMKLPPQSEDCLTLNVWAPAVQSGEKLPVIVSIHGGGFLAGWSGLPAYDGEPFARQGIVFVSMNYGLGAIGFLAHPDLSKESAHHSSGNYGVLDQIAALRWVQRNIAAFGGDAKKVTVIGESAGATSVALLLVSPLSEGLFQRAVLQSPASMYQPIAHRTEAWYRKPPAERLGGQIAPTASTLRALTAEEVIQKSPAPDPTLPNGSAFQPIVDGWVIPDDPAEVFESGRAHSVALIAGTNSDEGVAFTFFLAAKVKTVADYSNYLKAQFGDLAATAAELYPANGDAEVRKALGQLFTDTLCLYGTRAIVTSMARTRRDIYAYYFTRSDPVSRKLGASGAIHGAEFSYTSGDPARSLFVGTPGLAVSADAYNDLDRTLAKTMNAAWVRFVKTGNPNGPAMPEWPAVKVDDVKYLEFGDKVQAGSGLRERNLRFLADHFSRMRVQRDAGR